MILAGGPLGTEDAARRILHIVSGPDESVIRQRLDEDPGHHNGMLKTLNVHPWTVLLGSIGK